MTIEDLKDWWEWPEVQMCKCSVCGERRACHALYVRPLAIIWEAVEWLCPRCLELWIRENRSTLVARELML